MKTRFSLAYVFTYVCILCIVGCSREDNGLHGRADAGEQIKFTATIGSTSAATKAPASSSFRISDTRFSGTITPITASSYGEDIAWTQRDVITIAEAGNQITSDYEVDPSGQLSLASGDGLRWYNVREHRFLAVYPSVDQLGASAVTIGNSSNTSYQMNIPMAVDPMPTTQYCYKWDQDNGIRPYKGQDGATKNELYYGPDMRYARMTASSEVAAPQPQGVELAFYPQFSSVEVKLLKPDDMSGATVKLVGARLTAGSGAATDADLSGTPAISQPSASGTTMEVKKLSSAGRATVAYQSDGAKHNYIDLKFKDNESAAETSSPELNESTPLSFTFLLLPVDVTQLELELTLDIDGYQVFRTLKLKNADGWIPLAAGKKLTVSNLNAPAVDITPLTIEPVTEATTITISNPKGLTYQYSINGESWQSSYANPVTIAANPGDKVSLYQANNVALEGLAVGADTPGLIKFTNPCYAYGNVMSLAGFANKLNANYQFAALFKDNINLRMHSEKPMLLPATTLAKSCYSYMFYGCTGLTKVPDLPATSLAQSCYTNMFEGCTGLTEVPADYLPATDIKTGVYQGMFKGCKNLTKAPDLPATTLAQQCYASMFSDCTGLTKAPVLPATTAVDNCYQEMFTGCTSLNYIECFLADGMTATGCLTNWVLNVAPTGRFVKHPNAKVAGTAAADTWAENSVHGIPPGWTYKNASAFVEKAFTVNASGDQVYFSPGNLQAVIKNADSADGARWQFADLQYEYPSRTDGDRYTANLGDVVDLFMHPNAYTGPYAFGIPWDDGYPAMNKFEDWGQNKIHMNSTASTHYTENTYRTPTRDDWVYLLNTRTGAQAGSINADNNCRYSMVTVEGVFGMIIYPDGFDWEPLKMGPYPTSFNTYSASSGTYSGSYWAALEGQGVVFLPAAGAIESEGYFNNAGAYGHYWSGSVISSDSYSAYSLRFEPLYTNASNIDYRRSGLSVRLVRDIN